MEIMGIVNVTPDSFSDGGAHFATEQAILHGKQLLQDGATILDVGGESTRPGAVRISADEEWSRIADVVRGLVSAGALVSVDTLNASTARNAIAAGAKIINDVSGGLNDAEMYQAVAGTDTKIVLGHWRGIPDPLQSRSDYHDVVLDVRDALAELVLRAKQAGVRDEQIILDPGLGFDKTGAQCWEIIRRIGEIQSLGFPVLIGASRKRMIAEVLTGIGAPAAPADRDTLTGMISLMCAERGVWGVRVHDAIGSAQAVAGVKALGETRQTDKICLRGLEVFAHHGVFAEEKEKGQKFFIDATVSLSRFDANDELKNTVNYAELADLLVAEAQGSHDLIETLAVRLAETVLQKFPVQDVIITVHKPEAPIPHPFNDVSVTVTRRRNG